MQLNKLPLFPLQVVLYPGEVLPLHIFEDRYLELVSDCVAQEIPFGIVLFREGKLEQMGCTAWISKVEELEDGKRDIVVTGERRFRVSKLYRSRAYQTADIEMVQDTPGSADLNMIERVIAQHIKLLELAGRTLAPTMYQERDPLSFFIAHNSGLSLDQKQEVLELQTESSRIGLLIDHLEQFIPAVEQAESIRLKIKSNGHFKDFPPEVDK